MKVKNLIIGAFLVSASSAIKIKDDDEYDFYTQGNVDKQMEQVVEAQAAPPVETQTASKPSNDEKPKDQAESKDKPESDPKETKLS